VHCGAWAQWLDATAQLAAGAEREALNPSAELAT
jgi:hypothetical protein